MTDCVVPAVPPAIVNKSEAGRHDAQTPSVQNQYHRVLYRLLRGAEYDMFAAALVSQEVDAHDTTMPPPTRPMCPS
jgi:hypothetical protein